jgi:hypothetical protein
VYDPRRQDLWDDGRKKEQLHWSFLFSTLIAQWAQWLGNVCFSLLFYDGGYIIILLPSLVLTVYKFSKQLM